MAFSSVTFLFCYLPLTLLIGFALPKRLANLWLLVASLLFYAWPGPGNCAVLLFSIGFNWFCGLMIGRYRGRAFPVLAAAVAVNVLALVYFKGLLLLAGGLRLPVNSSHFDFPRIRLAAIPPGISFFTFHAVSYLVDIYRGEATAFASPLDLGLYLSFFPQLIAGPIARFRDIAPQIRARTVTAEGFASGAERFLLGLAKKSLLADPVGEAADHVFALPLGQLATATAWYGLLCFSVQIYFDFSGYSDMAIGLAQLFGFRLPENFRYPYAALSIRDFWHRWHITLSIWFRDYVYIPLGGGRGAIGWVALRLFLVFLLCGLWHGPSLNFIYWGLWHGLFLSLERGAFGRRLGRLPSPLARAYTLLVVCLAWVWFRTVTVDQALGFYATLFGFRSGSAYGHGMMIYYAPKFWIPLLLGLALSTPVYPRLAHGLAGASPGAAIRRGARLAFVSALFVLSASFVASETFHPFLYFKF